MLLTLYHIINPITTPCEINLQRRARFLYWHNSYRIDTNSYCIADDILQDISLCRMILSYDAVWMYYDVMIGASNRIVNFPDLMSLSFEVKPLYFFIMIEQYHGMLYRPTGTLLVSHWTPVTSCHAQLQ